MFSPGLTSVACLILAVSASAQVCTDFTGRKCSAAKVLQHFRRGFLLATTSNNAEYLRPSELLTRRVGRRRVNFLCRSERFSVRSTGTFFGRSDAFFLRSEMNPSSLQIVRIPFADYNNCFVADFGNSAYGCRLWVKESASPPAVGRCLEAIARVCPGPLYTTWDQQCVRGCDYPQAEMAKDSSQQKILQ